MKFAFRFVFIFSLTLLLFLFMFHFLKPVFFAHSVIIPYAISPFDICTKAPIAWKYIKLAYLITFTFSCLIFSNSLYCLFMKDKTFKLKKSIPKHIKNPDRIELYVGNNSENEPVYITESGLYQNILVTGTIGSGKTSSAMYPFTKQLMEYKSNIPKEKLGMLILDVKGNYYKQVLKYAEDCNRVRRFKSYRTRWKN